VIPCGVTVTILVPSGVRSVLRPKSARLGKVRTILEDARLVPARWCRAAGCSWPPGQAPVGAKRVRCQRDRDRGRGDSPGQWVSPQHADAPPHEYPCEHDRGQGASDRG